MSASVVRPTRSGSSAPRKSSVGVSPQATPAEASERVLTGFNGNRRVPPPVNEPVKSYAPGSAERAALKDRLQSMSNERIDIPLIIGGKEVHTGQLAESVMPHNHRHVLAQWHRASEKHVDDAVRAAQRAAKDWANWAWEDRAAVFLKAAELLATTWRATLNAATMLGQSKTAFQAEIDAACELIDFWRFNPHYAQSLYDEQPLSDHTMWNQLDYRPLEGFVYAVTPFNFTSIAGNDGKHRHLEARVERDAERALHHEAARGGGSSAGRDQLRRRRCCNDLRQAAVRQKPCWRAFHGEYRRLQQHVEDDRRQHVALQILPTHRRRNRRQGFHRRALLGGSGGACRRDRARRVRVPGPEMFGCEQRLRSRIDLAGST